MQLGRKATEEEVHELYLPYTSPASQHILLQVDCVISSFDTDNDGSIDFEEYMNWMLGTLPLHLPCIPPAPPLHLPYISPPASPLHLPYISLHLPGPPCISPASRYISLHLVYMSWMLGDCR